MRRRLLLIDDEPNTRTVYTDILTTEGYDVTVVPDRQEALAAIDRQRPDVIVLDADSGAGAPEVAGYLAPWEIPIVMIAPLTPSRMLGPIRGIRRIIYKPCRPRTLLEGIEDVLRYRR
ncbi:MAG: response regulator [Planctomycetes bacterium]|nr:response regulator [Planctomycetota bacterium]